MPSSGWTDNPAPPGAFDASPVVERPAGFQLPMSHPLNFFAGWWLILIAFVSGAILGLGFRGETFLGGYASFRLRLFRLGHISLAALGMINVLYGLAPGASDASYAARAPGMLLVAGAVAMPMVCFLAGWREFWRHLFFIPVSLLTLAVIGILLTTSP